MRVEVITAPAVRTAVEFLKGRYSGPKEKELSYVKEIVLAQELVRPSQ